MNFNKNINFFKSTLKTKKHFNPIEDKILKDFVENFGCNWVKASNHLGNRTPRQCKDRYMTYLSPDINLNSWTEEEDLKLKELVERFGKKWTKLARFLPGRSDNALKNRWNKHLLKKNNSEPSVLFIVPPIFDSELNQIVDSEIQHLNN